jgi:rhodanese-related sulfurtransferase/CBS domain-containing protein
MVREILRNEVQQLVADPEVQLVDVLPTREYEDAHLPGAIHLPLTELTRETAAKLRRDRPVIVYCHDARWDLSPRAAWRLESLGFTQVFDYVAGKVDWLANGLPTEGKRVAVPRVGEHVRRDVSTCHLTDRLGEVAEHVRASGLDGCVVVNEERVVLGLLRRRALDGDPQQLVEEVMEPGPSTFRPDVALDEMTAYLRQRQLGSVLVTTADGRLVGILQRTAAE